MQKEFWESRWSNKQTGFHGQVNHFLTKYFETLKLQTNDRVFIPLCGKTLDISWLLSRGAQVVGVEFVEEVVIQLFEELGIKPKVETSGSLKLYSAEKVEIYVGDFFSLEKSQLKNIKAVYDRAAIVALPKEMRVKYASHLISITENADQLLITYEYNQEEFDGPPFSLTYEEVQSHYKNHYTIKSLESSAATKLRGTQEAREDSWYLEKK